MRKTWEILEKNGELKREKNEDNSVQTRLLDFILAWKGSVKELTKNLTDMYEITIDKKEISATIDDLPFNIAELLSASDILAWVLEIPKKRHKKNIKAIERLDDKSYGAESFLDSL